MYKHSMHFIRVQSKPRDVRQLFTWKWRLVSMSRPRQGKRGASRICTEISTYPTDVNPSKSLYEHGLDLSPPFAPCRFSVPPTAHHG